MPLFDDEYDEILAEVTGIKDAIDARRATGYLSVPQHASQIALLTELAHKRLGVSQLRRAFSQGVAKGADTLRFLDEARTITGTHAIVSDIDWLCRQRIATNGWVTDAIRPEIRDYRFVFAEDLFVFRDARSRVLAILDHRKWQEPYPNAPWAAGWYYVLYVDPSFDLSPDRGNVPELKDWCIETMKPFRPYRSKGVIDLQAYNIAEHEGSPIQFTRAQQLLKLCESVERGLAEPIYDTRCF